MALCQFHHLMKPLTNNNQRREIKNMEIYAPEYTRFNSAGGRHDF
jgi:hypothetical protein